jgi:hypothetical protein
MQHDPYAPKYGVTPGQVPQQPMQYGGMPVQLPKNGMNKLLIPFILIMVLFIGAVGFGLWAFTGMQDYKNNSDKKAATAVQIAQQETSTAKDKEFLEKEKNPLKLYKGPAAFGTVNIQYPKTWSAFITESDKNDTAIDGYLHPNFVPGVQSGTDFALRVKVLSRQYADVLKQYESKVKSGKVKISPYNAPKVSGVLGSRIEGEINTGQQDSMVLFPLRDKTLEISTESSQFKGDFDTIILANLTFVP